MNQLFSQSALGVDDSKKVMIFLFILLYSGILYLIGFILLKFLRTISEHRFIGIIVTITLGSFLYLAGNPFGFNYNKITFDNSQKLFTQETKIASVDNVATKYKVDYTRLKDVLDKQKISYENVPEIEKIANTLKIAN